MLQVSASLLHSSIQTASIIRANASAVGGFEGVGAQARGWQQCLFQVRKRQHRVFGTKELVLQKNYLAVYRVKGDEVQILTILHAAQNR